MIQIYLLTGFLGAGKTTMLQALLKSYEKQKIGVIVNEFGEANVDARLIQRDGIQMSELSNGSIFCACIKDKFVDSLIEMSGRDLEFLFIEASGLADPANMAQILEGIKPNTKDTYLLRGSLCIVDAVNFLEMEEILPALSNQVEYAHAVIVNKADLVDEKRIAQIEERVAAINPDAQLFVTSYCRIDIRQIAENFPVSLQKSGETTNTFESRPNSFVLKADTLLPCEALFEFLKRIAPHSFRIKGFALTDNGTKEISGVREDIRMTPWEEPVAETQIVVISSVGIRMLSELLAASREILDGKLKV